MPWWKRAWKRLLPRRGEYSDRDFIVYLDLIPELLRMEQLPPAQALPECSRLFIGYQTNVTSELGRAVTPSWSRALSRHYETEGQLAAVKLALSIERFRGAHRGSLPESLQALVPDFVATIPRDLFDDQPLRFKPLTNGFVVYSIGADSTDNGGLEKTSANTQTNYDVTVTIER